MTDDFFTEFGETLHQAAKEFSAKTDTFFESQKIRNKINSEQRKIDVCLKNIGSIIYERFIDGELLQDDVAALCEQVTEHKVSIAQMREAMARKRGEKICGACGASLPKEAAFCMKCGAECEVEPEEEVVEDPKPAPEEPEETEEEIQGDSEEIFEAGAETESETEQV